MPDPIDIEQPEALVRYLRATQRIDADETPHCTVLAGGVSNRTVLVERLGRTGWVLKQALPRLRVKDDWFSDPARVQREALGLQWMARLAPAGSVPMFVFEDRAQHLLAMEAVPQPHENWKTRLLAGRVDLDLVTQFGRLLGTIHRRSVEERPTVETEFADRSFFESLRLEPYYRFSAARNPSAREFYDALIADTLATRLALVHGDYSPKNTLVRQEHLLLLDFEAIHWGDPAFDLGFSLTHLLSKAHHLPAQRHAFLGAAASYWRAYRLAAGGAADTPGLEARAVRHTLGCLLARVDGRSPLEYLTPAERDRQRAVVLDLVQQPPTALPELFRTFDVKLNS